MTFFRKLGVVGLGLTMLQGLADLADPDGPVGTAAELVMMTTLLGGAPADKTATGTKPEDDRLISLLSALAR